MLPVTPHQPQRSVCGAYSPTEHSVAASSSALGLARDAIARWRGTGHRDTVLPSESAHVSPQARWLEQAQAGLSNWIECGGFSQAEKAGDDGLPPLAEPVMYTLSWSPKAGVRIDYDRACVE